MEFTVAEQGIPERDRGLRHSRILRKKKMKITTLLTIIPKNHLDDVTSPMLGGRQWENCWAPTHCTILQRGRTCITMQYFHIKVQICLQNCKGLGAVSKDSFLQQAIPLESSRHPPSPLTLGLCNNLAFSWIEKGFTVWVIFAECWRPENCVVTVYQYYHLPFLCKTGKKSVQFAKGEIVRRWRQGRPQPNTQVTEICTLLAIIFTRTFTYYVFQHAILQHAISVNPVINMVYRKKHFLQGYNSWCSKAPPLIQSWYSFLDAKPSPAPTLPCSI